jgi:hypothetical protein
MSTAAEHSFIIGIVKHSTSTIIVRSHGALYFILQGTANDTFPTGIAEVSVAAWCDTLDRVYVRTL